MVPKRVCERNAKGGAVLGDGLNANPILTLDPNKYNLSNVDESTGKSSNEFKVKVIVFSQKTNGEQLLDIETYTQTRLTFIPYSNNNMNNIAAKNVQWNITESDKEITVQADMRRRNIVDELKGQKCKAILSLVDVNGDDVKQSEEFNWSAKKDSDGNYDEQVFVHSFDVVNGVKYEPKISLSFSDPNDEDIQSSDPKSFKLQDTISPDTNSTLADSFTESNTPLILNTYHWTSSDAVKRQFLPGSEYMINVGTVWGLKKLQILLRFL